MSRVLTILFFTYSLIFPYLHADVNILIIGSEKDSSEYHTMSGNSKAFSASKVKSELQKILNGAGLGSVNISLEERYKTNYFVEGSSSISYYQFCSNLAFVEAYAQYHYCTD